MKKKISVQAAADVLGKSAQYVRIGLQQGVLPIGSAVKLSSMWTYHISPKLQYECAGELPEGFKAEAEA
jgi:hypothetical protein